MAKEKLHAILLGDGCCSLVAGDKDRLRTIALSAEVDSAKQYADIATQYAIHNPLLALPSAWCYTATFNLDDLSGKPRYETMLYQLEEYLPMDAETLTASFAVDQHKRTAVGCAVESKPIKQVVDDLELQSVMIGGICPEMMLAYQALKDQNQIKQDHQFVLLEDEGDTISILQMHDGKIIRWYLCDSKSVIDQLCEQIHVDNKITAVLAVGLPDDLSLELSKQDKLQIDRIDVGVQQLIAKGAASLQQSERLPSFDLRRGDLTNQVFSSRYRLSLGLAVACVLLLLLSVVAMLNIRAYEYGLQTAETRASIEEQYQQAFPGKSVPLGVIGRLESEVKRIKGMSQAGQATPEQQSAMQTLTRILNQLPKEMRYQLTELQIESKQIRLYGAARSHVDANKIAKALDRVAGYTFELLRTENQDSRSVAFSIAGVKTDKRLPNERGQK
ncbi:hypothetical protein JD969_03690 [Planctomycetota bacterium]|nr:hypothetical protein JD969_17810 [Planctomycetota bacterium]QQE12581.1 hypothetical protein JD969_03690 [Planctomycetota bacterium]